MWRFISNQSISLVFFSLINYSLTKHSLQCACPMKYAIHLNPLEASSVSTNTILLHYKIKQDMHMCVILEYSDLHSPFIASSCEVIRQNYSSIVMEFLALH